MIENELLLLGLLKESPKHGYEIKRRIKEILSVFAGVDLKSVYYPLMILEKKGFVTKEVSRPGNRPQRLVYKLTVKGDLRFKELVKQSLLNFKRPQFSLDLTLYFLHYIKPEVACRRLRARLFVLEKLAKDLRQTANSLKDKKLSTLSHILEHNLKMVEAESRFLTKLTNSLSTR